jgi:hypothetical protein
MLLNQQNKKGLEIVASGKLAISSPKFIDFSKPIKNEIMLNNNKNNGNKKLCAKFKLNKNTQEISFKICGQNCKTLIALIEAKEKGITALEVSSWAFRLAAYIHILRSQFNLEISTTDESHKNGFHARYHLLDEVKILEVLNG